MGQVCSVLREKLFGFKSSSSDSSSVFISDEKTERQNYGKLDIEDQHDDSEVVTFDDRPQDPPYINKFPVVEVESHVVSHNTNTSPATHVDTLIDITNVLPAEHETISEYVTPRPPLKSFRERSGSTSSDQGSKKIKVEDYLDFPIFKDASTKQFIPKSKVMVVLRGLSGSGKSHIAAQLINLYGGNAVECSADAYFVQPDGEYLFDGSKLKDAHSYCFDLAKTEMESGRPLVIINNTNVKLWEYKRYLFLAKDYHYSVLLMQSHTPWAWDPALLAQHTQHSISENFLKDKLSQFQQAQPIYYGWFLNPADSALLVQRSWACLRAVAEIPECRRSLAYYCYRTAPEHMKSGVSELTSYYKQCGANGSFQPLHCTAMFANRGKEDGAAEYALRVEADMGRVFSILVTGFVITPRTIGVRVVLPDEPLQLWEQDDEEDLNRPPKVDEVFALVQGAGADQLTLEEKIALEAAIDARQLTVDAPDADHSSETTRTVPFERVQQLCGDEGPSLHRLRPFRRRGGRRAHLTVAVAPTVSAVTTGFDLMYLARLEDCAAEQEASPGHDNAATEEPSVGVKNSDGTGQEPMEVDSEDGRRWKGRHLHTIQGGTLADYGEGVFAFYPDECFEVMALFSASY